MADVNRGNRPLSPHLSIYRPQITMVMSITHRITGVALTLGAVLVVWWLLAAASGPDAFAFIDGLLTSWVGLLVLAGSAWALSYHTLNGIRHLVWDMGYGFELPTMTRSGQICAAGSVVVAILILIIA
jgi:succinate dehydrogenase / fumarate reductase cytochrome b subunit